MWQKGSCHGEPQRNRLAALLVLLLVTAVVCYVSALSLEPDDDRLTWAQILTLSGWFTGDVHAWGLGVFGLVYAGPPDNLIILNVRSLWLPCPVRWAALAASVLVIVSFTAWAVLTSLRRKLQEANAGAESLTSACTGRGDERQFTFQRHWRRASEAGRWA